MASLTRRCVTRSSIAPEFKRPRAAASAGQTWADALGKDEAVEPGDVVVTEERAKQLSAPPPQKGQPKGRQPATNPAATPAAPTPRAEAPPPLRRNRGPANARCARRPNVHSGAVILKIHRAGLHDGGGADASRPPFGNGVPDANLLTIG